MSPRTSSIVVGVLAVAFVALAVFTVVKTSDLNSKVSDLEDSTASLESATATGGKDATDEIKTVSAKLKKLSECVPEVQNEIGGLSIESGAGYAYIENGSQVSSYCRPLLYPEVQTGP
jgi:peptidoglycan hydrolase CwlO-like protein